MIKRVFEDLEQFTEFLEASVAIHKEAIAAVAMGSAALMHERATKTFGDTSKLAPLAQATQDERTSLGFTPDKPLLRDGSLLRDSVEKAYTPTMAAIGSDEPIMLYSEYGFVNARTGTSVPPRPVFKITAIESIPAIEEMLEEAIELTLGGVAPKLKLIP